MRPNAAKCKIFLGFLEFKARLRHLWGGGPGVPSRMGRGTRELGLQGMGACFYSRRSLCLTLNTNPVSRPAMPARSRASTAPHRACTNPMCKQWPTVSSSTSIAQPSAGSPLLIWRAAAPCRRTSARPAPRFASIARKSAANIRWTIARLAPTLAKSAPAHVAPWRPMLAATAVIRAPARPWPASASNQRTTMTLFQSVVYCGEIFSRFIYHSVL